ncbi:MAG TPA: hypothetical protein VGK71_00035 [Nitrospirota bacterium]|jgi:hypothetical protein
MQKLALAFVSLLLLALSSPSFADYKNIREEQTLTREVQNAFRQKNFKELEEMAHWYRNEKKILEDGGCGLYCYYSAVEEALKPPMSNDLSEADYVATLELIDEWGKRYPDSITQRVAKAGVLINFAWLARGNDWAYTVTEDGWRLFRKRIQKAYDVLKDAPADIKDDCPQRFFNLLIVARAQSWERDKCDEVFYKGMRFYPWYFPLLSQRATYLLPRWGGKEGEWLKFADEAVRLSPTSEGMYPYTYVVKLTHGYDEWKMFDEKNGVSWKKMKQGFQDKLEKHPRSRYYLTRFAFFAIKANDWQIAKELFDKIGNNPDPEIWPDRKIYDLQREAVNFNYNETIKKKK